MTFSIMQELKQCQLDKRSDFPRNKSGAMKNNSLRLSHISQVTFLYDKPKPCKLRSDVNS